MINVQLILKAIRDSTDISTPEKNNAIQMFGGICQNWTISSNEYSSFRMHALQKMKPVFSLCKFQQKKHK